VTAPYELGTAPPARRALAERLPPDVAAAAAEFITGPLLAQPRRVGKPLGEQLTGIHSARLGRDWRVFYEIDDARHVVTVLDIRHRSTAYRGGWP
jgi:mRNA-degrading endonuclease RelE of RelBE toxin-antitoxin system